MPTTLRLRCPNCHQPLEGTSCANGHEFPLQDGVLSLLTEEFRQELEEFIAGFTQLRTAEGKRLLDPSLYPTLPFTTALQTNPEWRMRTYDVAIIERLLTGRAQQQVLEIGAWNGWLSHRLTQMGHGVTAVDYFSDEYDGLRAMKFYPYRWRAIQMDLTDLSPLDQTFDVVILNRCIQFYADPVAYTLTAREKVAGGGLLLLTGLSFFRRTAAKRQSVAAFRAHLQAHGLDYFRPMKGYLDFADRARLRAAGVRLRPYPQLWLANLKSWLKPSAPRYAYGVWSKEDAP